MSRVESFAQGLTVGLVISAIFFVIFIMGRDL